MKVSRLQNKVRRTLGSAACLGLLFLGPVHVLAQDSSSSTKPTASQSPQEMDQAWQKASAKYDAARKALLTSVDRTANAGPYRPDWESLRRYEAPDWYKDAKFGIFIHWGVYSVPAFGNEWYPRNMYQEGSDEYKHHLATYGPPSTFGYKDFIPRFKAEHFDPVQWAELFKASGARYVVPVFEHHDGFAMYDSGLSDWTAVKMGPHRDMYGELAKALRERGLRLGASSHRIEHNFFLEGGRKIDSDVNDPRYLAFYGPAHTWLDGKKTLLQDWTYLSNEYLDDWLARGAEIVEKYEPDIMYFDWWIGQPNARRHVAEFASFYYNHAASQGKVPVINYKDSALEEHSAVLDIERGQLSGIRPLYWQTDTSISNKSWGYIENDNFKSAETVVHQLVDIVSKNGNLLLNFPLPNSGELDFEEMTVLEGITAWMAVNSEGIYASRPWKIYGEGPSTKVKIEAGNFNEDKQKDLSAEDVRFTTKGGTLYAFVMGWPENAVVVSALGLASPQNPGKIRNVQLLGHGGDLKWKQDEAGLKVEMPEEKISDVGITLKVELA